MTTWKWCTNKIVCNLSYQQFSCCNRENLLSCVCDLQLNHPWSSLIMTLLCHWFLPNLTGSMKTVIKEKQRHKSLGRMHLPAAGMRGEEGVKLRDEMYIQMLLIIPCSSVVPVIKQCNTDNHMKLSPPSFLSLSLHFSPGFLNLPLSLTLVFFLSHRLSFFYPAHSLSSPSLPASIVIYLYLKAIMFSFFHQDISSVTLVPPCVLPHSFLSSPFI